MTAGLPFTLSLGTIAFLLGVIWGKPFVEILRRLKIGKQIRIDLPDAHQAKVGTPTMGGLMIVIPVVVITAAMNLVSLANLTDITGASILVPLFVMVTFAALGAIDDWEGLRGKHAQGEGLSPRAKFLAQLVLAGVVTVVMSYGDFAFANSVTLPFIPIVIEISPALWVPMAMFVIVGMSNAVNFTDGMDGLAGIIAASMFAAYGVIALLQAQTFLVGFCLTVVGACFGFLWFNAHPAQLFMGDTGALALGATLGTVALMTGQWLLLPVIAVIPVAQTVSVVLQVGYFKLTGGKRLFKMAPCTTTSSCSAGRRRRWCSGSGLWGCWRPSWAWRWR
ncbi:MAG: phospho-N-acetylmuramoyl-pentapeptide-transferase [Anaerolineae bacterium]|nr:phospho-N-acetylmuramoyl-pentapeptide-transferase [Anaerolineae bacterium]